MSEIAALIFGAAIVVVFSYERFNRASYDVGSRLERLVALLSPDKLRARRVVLQAWVFYTAALLLIYVMLCAYAEVLPDIGGTDLVGAVLPDDSQGHSIGIPPSVSLGVALILVGLAPSVPVLKRFEIWMRHTAHRLAGIPTRVLNDSDELRSNAINLATKKGESLLIPRGYWERREHYRLATADQLTAPSDFANDIDLIFAVTAWLLDRRLKLDKIETREQFQMLEDELRNRKDVLLLELDERTGFVIGGTSSTSEDVPQDDADETVTSELKRRSWERVASDVDDLAEDFCILMALYVEHGLIQHDTDSTQARGVEESQAKDSPVALRQSARQQDLARERLMGFLQTIVGDGSRDVQNSHTITAIFWSFVLILGTTLVWSQWPGIYELELRWIGWPGSGYERAADFLIVAINGFCIPILIALALRDAMLQSKRWINVWGTHWTASLPQTVLVLALSWACAMFIVIAINFWNVAFSDGFEANQSFAALRTAFESNALMILRGSILAMMIVMLLDGHAIRLPSLQRVPTWKSSLSWALKAAAVMGCTGAFARTIASVVAARVSQPPRPGLDEIDYGLIFYAAVYSALIGFVAIYFLSEVLLNQWSRARRKRHSQITNPAE